MSLQSSPTPCGFIIANRYHIERKLGSGSMGTVYLARDELGGGRVALKVLRTERLDSEGLVGLQREFRAIAGLRHPQIARAHDFGYTDGERLPFYTREYIEGVPLPPGPPSGTDRSGPQAFLKPILDLLDALYALYALYALHAQGVLHLRRARRQPYRRRRRESRRRSHRRRHAPTCCRF